MKARLGPRTAVHSECALCVSQPPKYQHLKRERERAAVSHWAATGGCMKSASSSTPTPLTHLYCTQHASPSQKQSETENQALETTPFPPNQRTERSDGCCETVRWGYRAHTLYRISNHHFTQGWSCPRAATQADSLVRLLLPKLTQNWISGQLHPPPHLYSPVFLPVNAMNFQQFKHLQWNNSTWALFLIYYKNVFFLVLSLSDLLAQTFLRQTVICEYIHTVVALLSASLE